LFTRRDKLAPKVLPTHSFNLLICGFPGSLFRGIAGNDRDGSQLNDVTGNRIQTSLPMLPIRHASGQQPEKPVVVAVDAEVAKLVDDYVVNALGRGLNQL
jgi:hypothetical protein